MEIPDVCSDVATLGSSSNISDSDTISPPSDDLKLDLLMTDFNKLKIANEELKAKGQSLFSRMKNTLQNQSVNKLTNNYVTVCRRCKHLNVQRSASGNQYQDNPDDTLENLDKPELIAKINELTSQLSFHEATIKEDQDIIQILTDTIKIMTEYISKLEKEPQGDDHVTVIDSFNIFSPSRAPTAGSSSPLASSLMESRFTCVEADLSALLEAVQKLRKDHERNDHLMGFRFPSINFDSAVTSRNSSGSGGGSNFETPYTYKETEFVSPEISTVGFNGVVEHERLTAFVASKLYQIVKSCGIYTLYAQDGNQTIKSFFKFQNYCPLTIGGITYEINVSLERIYDREWGDVMSLRVCFPGIADCQVNSSMPDPFICRCLVVMTLLSNNEAVTPLQKYYVLHGVKTNSEPSHSHKSRRDCCRGKEEILDDNFCPFYILKNLGRSNECGEYSGSASWQQFWNGLKFEIKVFQLKYVATKECAASEPLTQEEKWNISQKSSHSTCSNVIFRIFNDVNINDDEFVFETLEACNCLLLDSSPLFKEMFQISEYVAPCEEIHVKNISKESLVNILNYLHGLDNGIAWRRDIQMNLDVLAFAHEYFVSELAQLSIHNLMTAPDRYYNLQLVLKLQSLASKIHNVDLENRALKWIQP